MEGNRVEWDVEEEILPETILDGIFHSVRRSNNWCPGHLWCVMSILEQNPN
jgi:hypothetical protein